MNLLRTSRPGAMLLVTVLLVGATALAISLNVALRGIGQLDMGFATNQSLEALAIADGCAQESLLRLSRDTSYTGDTLSVGDGECTIVVTTDGNMRFVTIDATVGRWTRGISLDIEVQGSTLELLQWRES